MSLLDMVQQQLGGGGLERISQQIGADPQQTRRAVDMALPVLVNGLAQNAQQPQGAASLNQALDQHTGTLDQIQGFLGGNMGGDTGGGAMMNAAANALGGLGGLGGAMGGSNAMQGGNAMGGGGLLGGLLGGAIGGKILGHILGGKQPQAQDAVAKQSGLDPQQVGKLLMILAPIVMGVLARRKQQDNLDAGGVTDVLQQTRQQTQQQAQAPDNPLGGILGQIFGR